MGQKVEIVLSHPLPEGRGEVGDRLEVDPLEAKQLVRAGGATYATKRDAKQAGDEDAPTARARK